MDIGANIRKARKIRGLTQIDVAEMAEIAVNSLRLYEAGKRTPNLEQLQHIARAIGVEWASLVDGDLIWDDEYAVFGNKRIKDEQDETTVAIPAEVSFTASMGGRVRATTRIRIDAALDQMTPEGQSRVADYAEDILLRYKAGEDPQNGGESTPAPQEGQSTTPPPDVPETPSEGE